MEQTLLTRLETIVKTLEDDQQAQRIPLEQMTAYEAEAQKISDALLQLYTGAEQAETTTTKADADTRPQ